FIKDINLNSSSGNLIFWEFGQIALFQTRMKKVLFLICFCSVTLSVFGWGQTGHRVTGFIAEKYLSKNARKELDRILNGQSLAIASTWMDEIRSDSTYDYTADWHWVTIQ